MGFCVSVVKYDFSRNILNEQHNSFFSLIIKNITFPIKEYLIYHNASSDTGTDPDSLNSTEFLILL